MLFSSLPYFVFLAIVFAAYWAMPWRRGRVYLLLLASFFFYATWNRWLAVLIVASTTLDYCIARGIHATDSPGRRKFLVTISVASNLGLLGFFKYANFFLTSLGNVLQAAGASTSMPVLKVILPVGISFYTFEAISYVVDVYRRRIRAERNLANLMLFILFFPHLVAGPIVRGRHFLPQTRRAKRWNWTRLNLGGQLIVLGLFKKLAIADRMALLVDPVFANPKVYGTSAIWMAVLAYSLQIYCDFSGYIDIALGSAHILGYKLPRNFDMPYVASNISAFWRRWNMTLSSWLRDYVYIPLGGSRGSAGETYRNLIVTLALGGLWHGANWTFVVWGLAHGVMLGVHHAWRAIRDERPRLASVGRSASPGNNIASPLRNLATVLATALTFVAVSTTWVLFRAPNFATAATLFGKMLVPYAGLGPALDRRVLWLSVSVVAIAHAIGQINGSRLVAVRMPPAAMGVAYAILLTLALLLSPEADRAFIYFQF